MPNITSNKAALAPGCGSDTADGEVVGQRAQELKRQKAPVSYAILICTSEGEGHRSGLFASIPPTIFDFNPIHMSPPVGIAVLGAGLFATLGK